MRLLSLLRPEGFTSPLIAAGLFAVLLASPASAEPSTHVTAPEAGTSDTASTPAGAQDDTASSQPQPVYPDGDPDIATVKSDDADAATTPSEPKVIVTIDKSVQQMTVWVDGVDKYEWPVSTGKPGYATPSGTYTPGSMNKIWYSKQWDNAPMPNAIFFTKKGHAIHGTNEVKNLGKPASHGCVRLAPKNAKTLFNLVKETGLKNTEVVLTGATPGGDYKVAHPPRQRAYPDYPGRGRYQYYDQYGYNDEPPPRRLFRKRRRFFQPYYDSPPPRRYERRRRWVRAPGY
jgi:lipoprotein-anchoring transpeptidase ErfK/SrfK